MPEGEQQRVYTEGLAQDFTGEVCPELTLQQLDPESIELYRTALMQMENRRGKEAQAERYRNLSPQQLLQDLNLVRVDGLTYAALILFGGEPALKQFLPQCELVYEYRPHQRDAAFFDRQEYRLSALRTIESLWERLSLRNPIQQRRQSLQIEQLPAFREDVVREALLNAIVHRDYRDPESIIIRQSDDPLQLEVQSPGHLNSTSLQSLMEESRRINRLLAEAFQRIGWIERSGQGINLMVTSCSKDGKPAPDYSDSREHSVRLRLSGQVGGKQVIQWLEEDLPSSELIEETDGVIFLNLVDSNAELEFGRLRQRVKSPHIVKLPLQPLADLRHRLNRRPLEVEAWSDVLEAVSKEFLQLIQPCEGTIHLFLRAPYSIAALAGRLLDQLARSKPYVIHQLVGGNGVSGQGQWQPFSFSPGRWQYRHAPSIAVEPEPMPTGPGPQGVLICIDGPRAIADESLRQVMQEQQLRFCWRFALGKEGLLTSPAHSQTLVQYLLHALDRVLDAHTREPIVLVSSAPVVLMAEIGRHLRPTVFHRVVVCEYNAQGALNASGYDPILELMTQTIVDPYQRLEILWGEEAALYRWNGTLLPVARGFRDAVEYPPEEDGAFLDWVHKTSDRLYPEPVRAHLLNPSHALVIVESHDRLTRQPWESSGLKGEDGPLQLRPHTFIVRRFSSPSGTLPSLVPNGALRILWIRENGTNAFLLTEESRQSFHKLLVACGPVACELKILDRSNSLQQIIDALLKFQPHILHLEQSNRTPWGQEQPGVLPQQLVPLEIFRQGSTLERTAARRQLSGWLRPLLIVQVEESIAGVQNPFEIEPERFVHPEQVILRIRSGIAVGRVDNDYEHLCRTLYGSLAGGDGILEAWRKVRHLLLGSVSSTFSVLRGVQLLFQTERALFRPLYVGRWDGWLS